VQRTIAVRVPRLDVRPDLEEEGHAIDVPSPREAHEPRALLPAVPDVLAGHEEVLLPPERPREERQQTALVRIPVEGDEAADVEESDLEARDGEAEGARGGGGRARARGLGLGLGRHGGGRRSAGRGSGREGARAREERE
jgi:hypothetical protein